MKMSRKDTLFYGSICCLVIFVASTAVAAPVDGEDKSVPSIGNDTTNSEITPSVIPENATLNITENENVNVSQSTASTTEATNTAVTRSTALITVTLNDTIAVPVSQESLKLGMKPRDVQNQTETPLPNSESAVENCSSALQGVWTGDVDIYPEKVILVADSNPNGFQDYCANLNETAQHLHEACSSADSNNSVEVAASMKADSLSTMVARLCSQNSTELKDTDSTCMESVKNATMACSSSVGNYSYPTEMLIKGMEPNTCKNLTEAKDCIVTNLAKGACTPKHQQVVLHLMDSLLVRCSKGDSNAPTEATNSSTTTAPNTTVNTTTTTTASSVNVTTKPSHPSASPSRNAAQDLRLHSIPLLLSMAFAATILASWM